MVEKLNELNINEKDGIDYDYIMSDINLNTIKPTSKQNNNIDNFNKFMIVPPKKVRKRKKSIHLPILKKKIKVKRKKNINIQKI